MNIKCYCTEWRWRRTLGAIDYENEWVKVDIDNWNISYVVEFKKKSEDDIYIYQANGLWHEVNDF